MALPGVHQLSPQLDAPRAIAFSQGPLRSELGTVRVGLPAPNTLSGGLGPWRPAWAAGAEQQANLPLWFNPQVGLPMDKSPNPVHLLWWGVRMLAPCEMVLEA